MSLINDKQTPVSKNIFAVGHTVSLASRAEANGHKGGVLWLTGLSGSGKSTLAMKLELALFNQGYQVFVLDGDNIRGGLNRDLGFSPQDRSENIRRIGESAALFADAGIIVITAFISPYRADRDLARKICPDAFHEVYIKADLDICEKRDVKGLYKKARAGKIPEFTGISAPYEEPQNAELEVDAGKFSEENSLQQLLNYVNSNFIEKETNVKVA
jgi:bifunctional enzyme CysN/CysC